MTKSLVIDRYVKQQKLGRILLMKRMGKLRSLGARRYGHLWKACCNASCGVWHAGGPASGKSDDETRSLHARTRVRDTFLVVNSWTHQTASYMHERLASLHWALDRSA
jgi:hypothetical protein